MRTFTCIANLEKQIEQAAAKAPLQTGVFGYWDGGGTVEIAGRWKGQGMFAGWCVRWRTKGIPKGLFSKGLAFYPACRTPELIQHLPIVK